jgi:hypothetical protein
MHLVLPSLAALLWLAGCDSPPPPQQRVEKAPNVYLEALQEAEALKDSVDDRNREQQRIDGLLGRDRVPRE